MIEFKNKKYIITGSTSKLGQEIAIKLAKSGASLILAGRNADILNEIKNQLKNSQNHEIMLVDYLKNETVENLINTLNPINGIIHCAGVFEFQFIKSLKSQDIKKHLKINYEVPVQITSELIQKKKLLKNSSVIFVSTASTKYPFIGGSLYVPAKAAIEAYCKILAQEYAGQKIRANCICPSLFKSEMSKEHLHLYELIKSKSNIYPLGIGDSMDVTEAVLYLLSEKAKWITGTNLYLGCIC